MDAFHERYGSAITWFSDGSGHWKAARSNLKRALAESTLNAWELHESYESAESPAWELLRKDKTYQLRIVLPANTTYGVLWEEAREMKTWTSRFEPAT